MLRAMPEPTSVAPPIFGVTVEQYAGVNAAVLEGFGLPEILASEGLDEAMWPRSAVGWSARIAKVGIEGSLSKTYQERLAFAQEWLGRRIEPLSGDLEAWFGFLGAWSAHPAPFDLLKDLGLQATDIARVQGAWTRRIEADEKLRKRVVEVAQKRLSALPKLTVTKATLRPFPWSRKAASVEATTLPATVGAAFFDDALGLDGYAEIVAELSIPRSSRARVLARYDFGEAAFVAVEAVWNGRFAADALLAQDFRRLVAHSTARRRAAENSNRPEAPGPLPRREEVPRVVVTSVVVLPEPFVALPRAAPAFAGTALALDLPRGPALPFVEGAASAASLADPPEQEEEKKKIVRPAVNLGGTALAVDVPRGPALPFARSPEASVVDPARVEVGARTGPANLGGTALAVDVPRGPALPFSGNSSLSPEIAFSAEIEPKIARPAAKLGGTALAVDVPIGPALPFAGGALPDSKSGSEGNDARSPLPVVAKRNKLAGLSFGLNVPKDLPLARSASTTAPAAAPKVLTTAPAPPPPLTLEQHASLCAELSFAPDREAEILARYRLTAPAKLLVDQFYRERVGESPEVRAAWDRGYRAYYAWLVDAARRR
jgi:hypothetical protein